MANPPTASQLARLKATLFILALLPLAQLLFLTVNRDFEPDFIELVQRKTGIWTLTLLLITLCISPLRSSTQWHWLTRLRRTLGLLTFFYAMLHFLAFIGLDHQFVLNDIARDIFKRPFITVGFAAFLMLIPLALTSNQFAVRRLGGRRWQELHRNVYPAGILGCLHYFWLTKPEVLFWPIAYSVALGLLLAWRIRERKRKAIPMPPSANVKPLNFYKQKPPG